MKSEYARMTLRLNKEDYERLKRMSEVSGQRMSTIIRSLINQKEIPIVCSVNEKDILYNLRRIGININQIATKANMSGTVDRVRLNNEISDLREQMNEISTILNTRAF